MSSEYSQKKNLGYQPAGEQRGYQPSKTSQPNKSPKPPAPTNTPTGGSAGKKE